MKRHMPLLVMLLFLVCGAAFAQGFNQPIGADQPVISDREFYNRIYTLATEPTDIRTAQAGNKLDFSTTSVRGGSNSGKPLGMYSVTPEVVYRSEYAKLDPKDWATWTCALQEYITKNGGGWDNYQRYVRSGTQPGPLDVLTPDQAKSQDPWDRSHVPYAKQEEFAKLWWAHYYPQFRKLGFVWKDWWVNDAILDGNLLIGREHLRYRGSADGVSYEDANLGQLVNKK
ncbi:MAG TPA: hypothetical protein EYM95_22730 [Candidatus Obscuribacterales bacterium]|jgi:hypothetical protein|nr:hypothetical protein [Candidatus Obscuribacterales bacterium]